MLSCDYIIEKLADTLQMKNKNLCLEIETLSSEYDASYQAKKGVALFDNTMNQFLV